MHLSLVVVIYRNTPSRSRGELDSDKFVNSKEWSSQALGLESSTPSGISSFPLYWQDAAGAGKSRGCCPNEIQGVALRCMDEDFKPEQNTRA